MNFTDILTPENTIASKVKNIILVIGFSWLIAISAQISIQLPFSPVPITGQTLVVLLTGLILGKNLAFYSVGLYLAQGAAGMPVFAAGKSGLFTLLGPTGGYLLGFLAAAYVVGMLSELWHKRSLISTGTSFLIGNIIIYLFGLVWLARFVGEAQALQLGLYPFLVGDMLKILLGIVLVGGSSTLNARFKTVKGLNNGI
jgi:biotin transport system substrate-specific component